MPPICTCLKIGEERVSVSSRECAYFLEVLKGRLHKPCIKRVKILRDVNFGRDANLIESQLAKLAWKLSDDEPISQLLAS
jgi:hypothetical protein